MQGQISSAWERVSLRAKLTSLSVALIGLLLVVSSLGTISLLRTYLQQNVDTMLISTATTLSHEDPSLVEARLANRQLTLPRLPSDFYVAYLDVSGNLLIGLVSSTNDSKNVPNLSAFTIANVLATHGQPFDADASGGSAKLSKHPDLADWRLVAIPLTDTPGSVVVALPTASNHAIINQYELIGAGFGILLLLISGLSIWLTITSALRPLNEVERTARAVAEGDISQRLIERPGKTEISRLNNSLNTMLGSIEGAMASRNKTLEQMRRFVADASHELRTPLVSVRGYAELYRMGALKKKEDVAEAMGRIESEAIRMTSLVESLLTLARLDDGAKLKTARTDLVSLANDVAKDYSVTDGHRTVQLIDLEGKPLAKETKVYAKVEANSIRQVLTNLLSNSGRFSPEGSTIEIAFGSRRNDEVIFEVRDHGEGIPEQLRGKVFERFYRADNSRNRETGGSGLGLSIVSTIIEHHDGEIVADETPGGGATFRVTLPVD
jgi:two-component system, OmpR family, sensor kinase